MQRWRSALLWASGIVFLTLLCCGGPATLIQAFFNEFTDNMRPSGDNESKSVADSRQRGVLSGEWTIVPSELEVPGGRLRFEEVWVEERSRSTHRLVWLPAEERVGGYRLQIAYTFQADRLTGVLGNNMLVLDDRKSGHAIGEDGMDYQGIFMELIDDPDVAGIRMSVVKSFDAARAKDIGIVPKGN